MKNSIVISFPENPKLGPILVKDALRFNGGNNITLDADKDYNSTRICLADLKMHHIYNVKFIGINENIHPDMVNRYQIVKFEGFYHKNNTYIKCLVEYKIRDLD